MLNAFKTLIKRRMLQLRNPKLSVGSRTAIVQSSFGRYVDIGSDATIVQSSIGDYSYIGPRTTVAWADVGRFCSIAPDVSVGSGSHPSRGTISSHPAFYLNRPSRGWSFVSGDSREEFQRTCVGNDVWIGAKVVIRDGINIGSGAFIGAGAVVVKDVVPYGVYVGVPAKLMRLRFSEDIIEKLLSLNWWDKDENWLKENSNLFNNTEDFFEKFLR